MSGNSEAEKVLRRRAEELAALHDLARDAAEGRELPLLLQSVVERAARLLGAPGGGLFLCDPDRREARCTISHNTPQNYAGAVLKYGEGAIGHVAQTGRPLIVDDRHAWREQSAGHPGDPHTALLCVPMVWRGEVTGVLYLFSNPATRRFSQADLELLTLFAGQAAITVENARLLDNERKQREVAQTLRDVARVLSSSLHLEQVVRRILEQLGRVVEYDSSSVMLESGDVLHLVAYRSFRFERREFTPLQIEALQHVQEVLNYRAPVIIADTSVDSRWLRLGVSQHTRCWLGVPLTVQDRSIGLLNLGKRQPNYYTPRDAELAVAFADQAAIAIENARLFEQLRAERALSQTLSRRLLEIQEAERRHIARELHDEVNQVLTGLKLTLETIRRLPPDNAQERLAKAQELVSELMMRMREMSLDLRPSMLDDAGLLPALHWHFDRYTAQTGVAVNFRHDGQGERLCPEVETAAYRIVQEALTNVARHAGVNEVAVRLLFEEDTLLVQIEDRGVGFDPEAARAAGGTSGVVGMYERAALLGGQLTVESAPGAGTCVMAELPVVRMAEWARLQ